MTDALAVNTIDPYIPSSDKPWNAARVRHLYNRLGFGATSAMIAEGLTMSPMDLVDSLLASVTEADPPAAPYWANWTVDDYEEEEEGEELYFIHKYEFAGRWIREMSEPETMVRAKIALFWHNHFVTQEEVYQCNSWMWEYYRLLHVRALSNFRTFTQEMGLTAAMLVFLNGNQNYADEPNENYARELMELFTMGENNGYTQNDVVEVARALTGHQVTFDCSPGSFFVPDLHDTGQKTIFGQTGNWNYGDVHDLIFTLRASQTAEYICQKIYKHFVHDTVNDAIVAEMATVFQDNDWELAPVFHLLFKSEHFFEARFINAKIKSPLETFASLALTTGAQGEEEYSADLTYDVAFYAERTGQYIFNPVDVAGWPGQRDWLNENTMTNRWAFNTQFLYGGIGEAESVRENLRQIAIDLTSFSENDPEVITAALTEHFLNATLSQTTAAAAVAYFKSEVPENYFEDGSWNLFYDEVPDQIMNLLYYLLRLPEWQLA